MIYMLLMTPGCSVGRSTVRLSSVSDSGMTVLAVLHSRYISGGTVQIFGGGTILVTNYLIVHIIFQGRTQRGVGHGVKICLIYKFIILLDKNIYLA